MGAGSMIVLYVAAAFAGTIVVRYQMTAWGSLGEDNVHKAVRYSEESLSVGGIIGHIREYSDPDVFRPVFRITLDED